MFVFECVHLFKSSGLARNLWWSLIASAQHIIQPVIPEDDDIIRKLLFDTCGNYLVGVEALHMIRLCVSKFVMFLQRQFGDPCAA